MKDRNRLRSVERRFQAFDRKDSGRFVLEGILKHRRGEDGGFKDELRYAILPSDWERLYDPGQIERVDGGRNPSAEDDA